MLAVEFVTFVEFPVPIVRLLCSLSSIVVVVAVSSLAHTITRSPSISVSPSLVSANSAKYETP